MSRCWIVLTVLVCWSAVALCCNKRCSKTDDNSGEKEEPIKAIIDVVNEICQSEEKNGSCTYFIDVPDDLFGNKYNRVLMEFTGLSLPYNRGEISEGRQGLLTITVSLSYSNLTLTLTNGTDQVRLNVTNNLVEFTFTIKPMIDITEYEKDCFFQWNHIKVGQFEFSAVDGDGNLRPEKLSEDWIEKTLNGKDFLDYLNQNVSICNKDSFLHEIAGFYVISMVLKGLGAAMNNLFSSCR